jgi:phosphoribosylglycinamide formyltransferase-1
VPARLVVLASGEGTVLQALLDAAADPSYGADVVAVGTDRTGIRALERAGGIPTFTLSVKDFPTRDDWDRAFADELDRWEPDLVVCAGFMKVLGKPVIDRFGGRIVNTHPALLPAFPGAHAVRDALAAGVRTTGVTVHWVDEGVDTGPVIAQAEVPVRPGDDEDALRERIQAVEKPLYVKTIRRLCEEITVP